MLSSGRSLIPALFLIGAWLFPAAVLAHLHCLIPDRPALKAGERAGVFLFFGHPFEREFERMERPEALKLHAPGGAVTDLLPSLVPEKARGPDGKEVTAFRAEFEAGERGDYLIAFTSPLRFEGEEEGFTQDHGRATVHVQAQRGWERLVGHPLEVAPLTRPYGLPRGSTFLARALLDGQPLEGAAVEVERYNPAPPAKLPEGEFITRAARSGPGGLIACTLDEAGWWGVTVTRRHGARTRDGKEYPLTLRSTLWVYAGEPLLPKE